MALKDITRQDVEMALEEFDRIHWRNMRAKYGRGLSTKWFIERNGRFYDQRLVLCAAHQLVDLKSSSLTASQKDDEKVKSHLEKLGFTISPSPRRSRREIPNRDVKDSADQYDDARRLLEGASLEVGVVLPLMNSASVAIELYLKCLASETVYVPIGDEIGMCRVYARAEVRGHDLVKILAAIDDDIRLQLEETFADETGRILQDELRKVEGALESTRYIFEPQIELDSDSLQVLKSTSEFLRNFVADVEPEETIQWKEV